MLFSSLNIEQELLRARKTVDKTPAILLQQVNELLGNDLDHEKLIATHLSLKKSPVEKITIDPTHFDGDKLFSIDEIEKVCVKYRLRFLKTGFHKNNFPYEVISKIKEAEKRSGEQLKDFYLAAPAQAFNLMDRNKDPLLFANLGNNKYYLIHKWGTDLAWHRRIWTFPLRNLETLSCTVLLLALLSAWLFPASFMIKREVPLEDMLIYRSFFFIWCVIAQGAALTYAFMAFHKNFSSVNWNSSYFN